MIAIEKSQNISDIERLLGKLERRAPILLPRRLHNWQIGGKASLIQFLITWAKRHSESTLYTHIQNSTEAASQLTDLCNQDHGLVAVLIAKNIFNLSGKTSLKSFAYDAARSRVESMWLGPSASQRGGKVFLLCADMTTKAALPAFYNVPTGGVTIVKDAESFEDLAKEIVTINTKRHKSSKDGLLDEQIKDLGNILWELFKNTDEWAKSSWDNSKVSRSVRGIISESHLDTASPKNNLRSSITGVPPLEKYFSHFDRGRAFLEISIFDSGPGLAQRWLSRPLSERVSIGDEYGAIVGCLAKHGTTSDRTNKGLGLHTVMTLLDRCQGFLRVRTGRLSLFRNFVEKPYLEYNIGTLKRQNFNPKPYLIDWETQSLACTLMPFVEGTLTTMVIPLRKASQ